MAQSPGRSLNSVGTISPSRLPCFVIDPATSTVPGVRGCGLFETAAVAYFLDGADLSMEL